MAKKALVLIGIGAAGTFAAAARAQDFEHGHLVGGAFGATSYEATAAVAGQLERSYKVGFHFDADFYRNDGYLTHLVTFDYAATESYAGEPIKIFDFNYNSPIYFTPGPLRPAVRPFFGARFATGDKGGSLGQLGILGGVRFRPSPTKCIFSDIYFGWRGRYGSLAYERAEEPEGWKSGFAFRNANTIEIVKPLCIYITAALDYDFTKIAPAPATVKGESESRKPTFSGAFGPAFFF
ncbi:MAG: hypothetical protein GTN49_08040 [candidate division Zixibacteria bacterium]|nr:hypothetical protein [candidate division Zixibacteria bacterium]